MDKIYNNIYLEKAKELVSKMTVEEKTSQLCSDAPAIERLGIPSYHWWNEGLHGVARAGIATVFPQAIGLAATFDKETLRTVGRITALEGRIKYNAAQKKGDHTIYKGLTFWSPNINIYRDPRWGRGQETYGEDPYLTSVCGENYIKALQEGEDDRYMRATACAKHFAVHSGPEGGRHGFDSVVSDFDLNDTYLPAFKWCVEKANVQSVMGAYNMINGIPSCAHKELIDQLRGWGFNGYFVSDCGALADMHMFCLVTHTAIESAALALKAGCNLNCGNVYLHVLQAYYEGKVTEEDIDRAVIYNMATRYKLGMFDPTCKYNEETDYTLVECDEHRNLSYEAAVRSIVMLKNNGILPLSKETTKTIAVIGPNAQSIRALEGNYNGRSGNYRFITDGLRRVCGDDTRILYAAGCPLFKLTDESCAGPRDNFAEALTVAEAADVVIMCMGIDPSIEGEEGDANNEYGAGDKPTLLFPGLQNELIDRVKELGKPIVLVTFSGGAMTMTEVDEKVDASLFAWYPGAMGGDALADLIFGVRNPSGKTPVTFYKSVKDLPAFDDYCMEGRTYRYIKEEPLYPFGYGLSYTTFSFGSEVVSGSIENGNLTVTVPVKNTGDVFGEEVVQIYATFDRERYITPNCKLVGFERVALNPGEEKLVTVAIENDALLLTDKDGERYLPATARFRAAQHAFLK